MFPFHFQIQETNSFIGVILEIQPRLGGGGGGKSNDEIVYELADSIMGKLTEKLDIDDAKQHLFEVNRIYIYHRSILPFSYCIGLPLVVVYPAP